MKEHKAKYKRKVGEINTSQKDILINLGMKKGYRVYSAEELDLPLIHNYELTVSKAKKFMDKEKKGFIPIFNAEGDAGIDGFSTSLRHQLNLNVEKYDGLVDIFRIYYLM
jgi:hypothetical protein